jgi:uncharacterized membrane protein YraQ (UPF0718 family)
MTDHKHTDDIKQKNVLVSFYKSFKSFSVSRPVLTGIVLLLGLFRVNVSPQLISSIFSGEFVRDVIIGSIIGSISAGNPITSYIIGAELLNEGVSLFAVTAFIVAWVTVGIIQFPAEAAILGKKFALKRNLISFILSIFVSLATVTLLMVVR